MCRQQTRLDVLNMFESIIQDKKRSRLHLSALIYLLERL